MSSEPCYVIASGMRAVCAAAILWPAISVGEVPVRVHSTLPDPVTNNAVAAIESASGVALFSFLGLGPGRAWSDTLSDAYRYEPSTAAWGEVAAVPGEHGRLAATAVAVGSMAYVFGGYTVAEDDSEVSDPGVYRFDPSHGGYERLPDMPVPVDDTVSLSYRDRYVYLISGWHMSGNVNLVQVYDTATRRWFQATPYPGKGVFGHAGGIVGDTFIVCDGVAIETFADAPRGFAAETACFAGTIRADDVSRIDWYRVPHHPGPALYRMAAVGHAASGRIVFAGGSDNPYNYDGNGYDGRPSEPSSALFAWDLERGRWQDLGRLQVATMDHRGLLVVGDELLIVGGMRDGRSVSASVLAFVLPPASR